MRVKLITSAVISKPALDEKGKEVTATVKFKNRDTKIVIHDHVHHKAGVVLEVSDELAAELVRKGAVHPNDLAEDDAVDPLS